jgi:hypothetical protein
MRDGAHNRANQSSFPVDKVRMCGEYCSQFNTTVSHLNTFRVELERESTFERNKFCKEGFTR